MTNTKFQGTIGGEDYELFQLVIPHHDEFQQAVGNVVHKFANTQSAGEVINVVDIGAGTGLTTKMLLDADRRIKVTAIDDDERMIDIMKSIFLARVSLVQTDAIEALRQLPSNSVDIVASVYCIHNMPVDWRASLFIESYRVLRPGGLVVNGDKIAVENEAQHQGMIKRQFERFKRFNDIGRADLYKEWCEHYHQDDQIKFTETEQRGLLKAPGFKDIHNTYRTEMEAVFVAVKS